MTVLVQLAQITCLLPSLTLRKENQCNYTLFFSVNLVCQKDNNTYLVGEIKTNKTGWGNQDKQTTAPLNEPYYYTNTALFTSFTFSIHMLAISHWPSHIIDVGGECKGHKLGHLAPTATIGKGTTVLPY